MRFGQHQKENPQGKISLETAAAFIARRTGVKSICKSPTAVGSRQKLRPLKQDFAYFKGLSRLLISA
jgi:hypothetical protein